MITISAALKAHLAQPYQTTCTIWKVTLTNGTVLGFTDLDLSFTFQSQLYQAATGYIRTDIAYQSDLSIGNMELHGPANFPSITEADVMAGLWDFAAVEVSLINWNDFTMGKMILCTGTLGEITMERNTFKTELRNINQCYTRMLGELTSPGCRADLFDSRCQVSPTTFTVTSTITGVNPDGVTLYDTARTEPGPTGAVNITNVTQANPGHVTTATALNLPVNSGVVISAVTGMVYVNAQTILRNPSGTGFDLGIDTSAYPAYAGGGIVTPLGGSSGYFQYGKITFTSGLNNGLAMEVKSYVPGQIVLELPMPYAVAIGDAYSMRAGCDKSLSTCKTRYSNVVNFRGEPYLPGIDKMVAVGKQP
jgi:hypothetical protein